MKLEQAQASTITELRRKIEPLLGEVGSLEEASKVLTTTVYSAFQDSVVLARVFLTVPFKALPPPYKKFTTELAEEKGATLEDDTSVLALLSTRGQESDWNDPAKSQGHMGIPLVSSSFVDAIPMISRLLKELGVPLEWVDKHDTKMIQKVLGGSAGVFYVEDAAAATDAQGRKIIAAQDFVAQHKVKSVFGTGAAYSGELILVIVLFCRDTVPRRVADLLPILKDSFKSKTAPLVEQGKIFAGA